MNYRHNYTTEIFIYISIILKRRYLDVSNLVLLINQLLKFTY